MAALNHRNIAAIHGLETSGDLCYLVLELVPGQRLDEFLAGGRPEPRNVLRIASQIAEALEAAHERGIVHRDLKPANVKITPSGDVKVLDFGLAKALDSILAGPDAPTARLDETQSGVILGTAAYMSPEQARGKPVDKRSDIWAFGCVLYEMLA
ncbi:MAG TPA: serine/threonine-protein kinase, partial [Bryobacteraceae bacterium]|nr:serine/threonine-protein kinase [Bryobacteraceae bacterium]